MDMTKTIKQLIKEAVTQSDNSSSYRDPLVGFAAASDHLFTQIKHSVGPHHLHPREMLQDAQTVVAFFIPFARHIIKANRDAEYVAREWAVAYVETNRLISSISERLVQMLKEKGYQAVAEKPTHNFNEADLTAGWSHKSMAYVAGLGTFGVNRMLITEAGCAGRCGSVLTTAVIAPGNGPKEEYCGYYGAGKCLYCVKNCPIGALNIGGIDKQACYQRLLEVDRFFADLDLCDVCGKCAMGPCAAGPAR